MRCYAYIRSLGAEGLRDASVTAVLNANYLLARLGDLAPLLPLAHGERCMHEFVLSGAPMKRELGIRTLDLAKRLLDHGFHPPTVYFPLLVDEALLIEPTETETRETLDAFAEAIAAILAEAAEDPEIARTAPHTTPVRRLDEAGAAKRPVIRQSLCFPRMSLRVLVGSAGGRRGARGRPRGRRRAGDASAEADAIFWLGPRSVRAAPAMLHDRVRWVQLPRRASRTGWPPGSSTTRRIWTSASEAYGTAWPSTSSRSCSRAPSEAARLRASDVVGRRHNGGQPLFGATMVVVGTGSIGRGVIRLLAPWGMTFVGVSRSPAGRSTASSVSCRRRARPGAPGRRRRRDRRAVHAGHRGAHRAAELDAMSDGAWLMNVARGCSSTRTRSSPRSPQARSRAPPST